MLNEHSAYVSKDTQLKKLNVLFKMIRYNCPSSAKL